MALAAALSLRKSLPVYTKCSMQLPLLISTLLLLLTKTKCAVCSSIGKSLPGFPEPLPFKLEAGYIGLGEHEDVQLFYYFVESERNSSEAPLMLWIAGGPGCSALCGLWLEIGPLRFNMVKYNGSLPTFSVNPHSWTKVSSIIFVDAPVGTGFSYSRSYQGYKVTDKTHAHHCHSFLRKWLVNHPRFARNPVYIGGDSYSGKLVPIVTKYISDANEAGETPKINLKGYVVGNPVTDPNFDFNSRVPFSHRMALISDDLYESAERTCRGEYIGTNKTKLACWKNIKAIEKCIENINLEHILEPNCPAELSLPKIDIENRRYLTEKHKNSLLSPIEVYQFGCRNYVNALVHAWANDVNVQKALFVRLGTVKNWVRCNGSMLYTRDVSSAVGYHRYLRTKKLPALIYSGDHDMCMPYLGTLWWINSLNSTIVDAWRPWLIDGQIAGYVQEYSNYLTFATVKGGGHTAAEYKPKECFEMFKRWISHEPL
ncbi:hypothetical protein L6164_027934 [Bauhinia variegata]|uniref:Uncharacterized protein n=1 Tax=Bauhinia variegata TaxID=167791 RepID=A0ACB9LUV2_BAUVA|nr:hypothetical protein L6164_027934 [Bauhinia variegata]